MELKIVNDRRDEAIKTTRDVMAEAMEICCLTAERYAKAACPWRTGRLRNSITYAVVADGDDVQGIIGTNVEYAPYVEYGTSRQKAHHYLQKAATNHSQEYKDLIASYLKAVENQFVV